MPNKNNLKGTIKSVRVAVDVLKCLSNGVDRLSDISDKLNLSPSTVHRLLKTLVALDMVSQEPKNRRYYLGNLFVSLASPLVMSHQKLMACAYDEMKRLRDLSHETVIIYSRVGYEVVCLEELPSQDAVKYTAGKGTTSPLNVGSASLVLLSQLSDIEVNRIIKGIDFIRYTPNTIVDKDLFLDMIRQTRKQGCATSHGTFVDGAAGISVPIRNYLTPIALSILGPENRFGTDMMDILPELKASANLISSKLKSTLKC